MEPSCPLGTTHLVPQEKFPRKPHNKSFIDQACSVKMVGYLPRYVFASLWTSIPSRSINTQKKNLVNIQPYYTTQAVKGPITKINQSKCYIAGPIFSKYWTRHCPEWSRTCVFAFFSRVINLFLTKLARDRTGRISALGLFCTDLTALGPYRQDPGPIFSRYGPRAWLIRYVSWSHTWVITHTYPKRESGIIVWLKPPPKYRG